MSLVNSIKDNDIDKRRKFNKEVSDTIINGFLDFVTEKNTTEEEFKGAEAFMRYLLNLK